MRNTMAHPITKQEIIQTIERLEREELESERVGSTDAIVLRGLRQLISDLDPKHIEKYIKH